MKADDTPLTRADREANAVICDALAGLGMFLLFFSRLLVGCHEPVMYILEVEVAILCISLLLVDKR